ncbi:MAG: hypothetical protein ACJ79H_00620 [Myxococcales bacterium]
MNVLRAAGGWLFLLSVLQLCAAAAVACLLLVVRGPPVGQGGIPTRRAASSSFPGAA